MVPYINHLLDLMYGYELAQSFDSLHIVFR